MKKTETAFPPNLVLEPELFSVISPCFNGEKYLPSFLNSILNQTYPKVELVLADDGSTDNTFSIASSYIDKFNKKGFRLIVLRLDTNRGQAAAINYCLKYYTGHYLMWMDSDDVLYENAIEEKVKYLKKNSDLDFCINEGVFIEDGKIIGRLRREKPIGEDNLFEDLIYENNVVFGPGSICIKTEAFKRAIPTQQIFESREGQNWQLMLPISYNCKWGYIEEPLFACIVHADSHSRMKRDYEQEKKRLDNFEELLCTTINGISEMSQEERSLWAARIHIKTLNKKLNLSLVNRKKNDYQSYKKALKKRRVKVSIKKAYSLYPMISIYETIKQFCKQLHGKKNDNN